MFNWFKKSSENPNPKRKSEPEPEREFRPAKLPPRRSEPTPVTTNPSGLPEADHGSLQMGTPLRITWKELTVDFQKPGAEDLLRDWRWLVGESVSLLLVSAIGDMFLADSSGRVLWLDTGTGQLQQIASSLTEFQALRQQREQADQWFIPQLIGDLIASGVRLSPGQCYSYKKPPILGGEIQPANFEPMDLAVHFSVLGQIHKQVKDLPPGTKITNIKIQ